MNERDKAEDALFLEQMREAHRQRDLIDEPLVRELGERMGYGRVMQLCEKIWNEKDPGGAHASYCSSGDLVPCPGCRDARERHEHCEWCCGAGRVTRRVAKVIRGTRLGGA